MNKVFFWQNLSAMYLLTYIIAAYFMHLHTNILIFQYYKVGHFIYYQPNIIKYSPPKGLFLPLSAWFPTKKSSAVKILFFSAI